MVRGSPLNKQRRAKGTTAGTPKARCAGKYGPSDWVALATMAASTMATMARACGSSGLKNKAAREPHSRPAVADARTNQRAHLGDPFWSGGRLANCRAPHHRMAHSAPIAASHPNTQRVGWPFINNRAAVPVASINVPTTRAGTLRASRRTCSCRSRSCGGTVADMGDSIGHGEPSVMLPSDNASWRAYSQPSARFVALAGLRRTPFVGIVGQDFPVAVGRFRPRRLVSTRSIWRLSHEPDDQRSSP
jgi:hypothetical protein